MVVQVPGREAQTVEDQDADVAAPPELLQLLEERQAAKQAKDFARADEIRELCAAAGYAIVDVKGGASSLKKL
jgi:cysteinyl-tRNA synthetase